MSTAFELTVTPAIMAFLGWRLDLWLGTPHVFLAVFFLFTISYVSWKMLKRYEARMSSEAANIPGLRGPNGPSPDGEAGR